MSEDLPILKGILKNGMGHHYASVRFGRVPKREKAKILAAMQSVNARSQEKALIAELEDETKVINTIVRAHLDTCDFTKDKIGPMLQRALDNPSYTTCPSALACPLNPKSLPTDGNQHMVQDFSERFSPAIRGVVEFAKRLPGFALLSQEDQVTLLKSGVFEVLLVRLACMFDSQTNTMICLNGQVLKRESIQNSSNARFLMDSMFDFAERLNGLRLNDAELGLFCAIVVISADRPGLRNLELISRMQEKVDKVLRLVICQNHPQNPALYQELRNKIHDLRTLNTLHCEKLLAFKMTEQQQHWQQQQEQLHQQEFQNHWGMEDGAKSPSWSLTSEKESDYGSPSSGYHPSDESVRSPLGSVSSEPVCTSELPPLHVINVHRSGKDLMMDTTHWDDKEIQHQKSPFKRKADSPNDSGMESTTEKSSSSANTSVCSSPRSSFDEKVREVEEQQQQQQQTPERHEPVEDMPLLKQALQKPPLVNTDSILEKAYVPHKKFRALRRDSVERETTTSTAATGSGQLSQKHSTLAQRLLEGPKLMSEEQLKRSEAIHNMIMQGGGVETDRTVAYHHQHHPASAAAASATTCPMTRLPSTSGYYIPQSSGATPNNCWPFLTSTATISGGPSQPQTPAVPSRLQQQQHPEATLLTLTPVQPMVQPQPRISTMTSVPGPSANNTYYPHRTNGYHHHHPLPSRTPSSHTTQVVTLKGPPQLQAVVRKPIESSQPLNLSTKTPPPRPLEV